MVSVWPYGLRRGTVCFGGFGWSVRGGFWGWMVGVVGVVFGGGGRSGSYDGMR